MSSQTSVRSLAWNSWASVSSSCNSGNFSLIESMAYGLSLASSLRSESQDRHAGEIENEHPQHRWPCSGDSRLGNDSEETTPVCTGSALRGRPTVRLCIVEESSWNHIIIQHSVLIEQGAWAQVKIKSNVSEDLTERLSTRSDVGYAKDQAGSLRHMWSNHRADTVRVIAVARGQSQLNV